MEKENWIESTLNRAGDWPIEPVNPFLKTQIEARIRASTYTATPSVLFRVTLVITILFLNLMVMFYAFPSKNSAANSELGLNQLHFYSYE